MRLGTAGTLAEFSRADVGRALEVRIEVPRWSFAKRKADGRVDLVSPLPCPYNYGSVVDSMAPDGDPLDALVLGPRLGFGTIAHTRVWAVMGFRDAGVDDPKLVCADAMLSPSEIRGVERFFAVYAAFKSALHVLRGRPPAVTARLGWIDPSP
jgi:inorganic pyrophosphatase